MDAIVLCHHKKDIPPLLLSPSLLEMWSIGNHRAIGNIISIWVQEGAITSLQAFQEEGSASHSDRLGPRHGFRRPATLWPRPPDMQEPGPKETGTRGQLLPGSHGMSRAWEQHALPTARAVDGLSGRTSVAMEAGVGQVELTSHRSPCAQPQDQGTGQAGSEASCQQALDVLVPLPRRCSYMREKWVSSTRQD